MDALSIINYLISKNRSNFTQKKWRFWHLFEQNWSEFKRRTATNHPQPHPHFAYLPNAFIISNHIVWTLRSNPKSPYKSDNNTRTDYIPSSQFSLTVLVRCPIHQTHPSYSMWIIQSRIDQRPWWATCHFQQQQCQDSITTSVATWVYSPSTSPSQPRMDQLAVANPYPIPMIGIPFVTKRPIFNSSPPFPIAIPSLPGSCWHPTPTSTLAPNVRMIPFHSISVIIN